MRYFTYVEPDWESPSLEPVYITVSEEEILNEYFAYWSEQMRKAGKEDLITPQDCIDDWMVVNWAWEVIDECNTASMD